MVGGLSLQLGVCSPLPPLRGDTEAFSVSSHLSGRMTEQLTLLGWGAGALIGAFGQMTLPSVHRVEDPFCCIIFSRLQS